MTQSLNYISAAADGCVLGIAANGQIMQAVLGPSWNTIASTNISGKLTSIGAASDGTVWGISTPGSVWQYAAGTTGWTSVTCPYPVTQISVGSANNIWAADGTGNVYQYVAGSGFTARATGIVSVSAASDGSAWGLDGTGAPQQYNAGSNSWTAAQKTVPEAFISLSAGTAEWVAAVGKSGKIYQYDGGNPNPWILVATALQVTFQSVSAGNDTTIWALDAAGHAYYYGMANQDWIPVATQGSDLLSEISVGDEAAIWGLDSNGNIYQITVNGLVWKSIATTSSFTKLSVGSTDDIWALDSTGNVYQNTGGLASWNPQSISGGPLSVVSAAADGTVYGLAPGTTQGTYNVVRYVDATTGWEQVACPYAVVNISAGNAKTVIASDGSGNVYEYFDVDGWKQVPANNTKATGVSVASDGTMWGIDPSGKACAYVGKTDGWYSTPVTVQQVAVGCSTNVWAIDTSGDATQLVNNSAMMSEASIAPRRASLAGWDTENPFDETQSTHLWIVNRAAQLAGQDPNTGNQLLTLFPPFQAQIGLNGPDQGFHDKLCQGLYDVDFLAKYNGPSVAGQASYASHFYDPDTGENWLGSSSWTALVQGRKLFWKALDYYVNGDMQNAGYHLGLSLHYLTDLTQPMHAANFTWLNSFSFGYHTAFESYVMEMQSTVSPPTTLTSSSFGGDPGEYFIHAAYNSKYGYYTGITPLSIVLNYSLLFGLTNSQRAYLQPFVAPILTDAINITAQYLVAWMALTDSDIRLCQFISSNSGYAMDINNSSSSAGMFVQQYTWNNTEAQGFHILQLTGADEGYCAIIASCSGMALDVQNQSTAPNAQIVQNPYNTSSNSQKWQFIKTDEATVTLVNKNSNLRLTVSPPLQQSGSKLIQGIKEDSGAQQWQLTPATPVYIQFPGTGFNFDLTNSSSSPGAILQIYGANTTSAQHFLLVPLGGADTGYYMILTQCGGLALSGASEQVMQEQWNSSDAQKWTLVPAVNGSVLIRNKASNQYMSVQPQSGSYQSGSPVITAPSSISFVITPAPVFSTDADALKEQSSVAAAAVAAAG